MGELEEGDNTLELIHLGGSLSGGVTSDFVITDCGIFPSNESLKWIRLN